MFIESHRSTRVVSNSQRASTPYYLQLADSRPERALLRRQSRIDSCACCYTKHLSFCCEECMQKTRLGNPRINEEHKQSLMISLNTMRETACSCCEANPRRGSKCCLFCRRINLKRFPTTLRNHGVTADYENI